VRCATCDRVHENVKGKCPFCSTSAAIQTRQRQRPLKMHGSHTFACTACGQEIKKWETVIVGGVPYEMPVGHDKCSTE
jgi:hypothetical protein